MASVIVPVVDLANPMYCSDVAASEYLCRIRQTRPSSRYSYSFAQSLIRSAFDSQISSDDTSCLENTFIFPQNNNENSFASTLLPSKRKMDDVSSNNVYHQSKKKKASSFEDSTLRTDATHSHVHSLFDAVPCQDSSGSAFEALINGKLSWPYPMADEPPSFQIVARLERDLYGHLIGAETPGSLSRLLATLNHQLPEISLSERLSKFEHISHQSIVDLLGANGCLERHILEHFRSSSVKRIDLSATFSAADGLNESRSSVVLDIFSSPHSFSHLNALNLNNVPLDDFDLTFIHHLVSLTTICLNSTTIGNEAIGHLTSLKKKLKELHIEDNPRITDDCIPSLCLFSSLTVLRIYGTSIDMPGLRRLAISIHGMARDIDIEIPKDCEDYLNNLHAQYQLHPVSPMITDPNVCECLSVNALKANLAGHAVFNPSISLSGSKPDLVERLQTILERRDADRVVKEIVWGYESSMESIGENGEAKLDV